MRPISFDSRAVGAMDERRVDVLADHAGDVGLGRELQQLGAVGGLERVAGDRRAERLGVARPARSLLAVREDARRSRRACAWRSCWRPASD